MSAPVPQFVPREVDQLHISNPLTGIQMYCDIQGRGDPPLVLLHGWTSSHVRWMFVQKILAQKYRVIAYDLRGHGLSDKRSELDYGFCAHVMDLLGLLDALEIPKAVICGHSMGGMIAQQFALTYPERVEKLVLVATAAAPAPQRRRRAAIILAAGAFLHAYAPAMWLKDRHKRKLPHLYPDLNYPAMKPGVTAASLSLLSIAHYDVRERLGNLAIPALVMASYDDDTLPFEQTRELADLIPGAEFVTLRQAGHHIPLEFPEFTAQHIRRFVDADPGAGGREDLSNAPPG